MISRGQFSFFAVPSSEPSFNSTLGSTSQSYVLETTSRIFQGPSGRAVRIASRGADDYYIAFGSSLVVVTSSGNMFAPGGMVETFFLKPSETYIAVMSSTSVVLNVTLGYGQ